MSRVLGPDERDREIKGFSRDYQRFTGYPGHWVDIFLDEECTQLADIRRFDSGDPEVPGATVENSRLRLDGRSKLPRFWYPHGVTRVFGRVHKGTVVLLDAKVMATNPGLLGSPGFVTGVLQAKTPNLATDFLHGIRIATIEIGWDAWEPTEGALNSAYVTEKVNQVKAYRRAGYRVGIVPGVHYPPAWLLAKPGAQHVDQWGNQSGGANFQWSPTVREYAAEYLTGIVDVVGEVDFHRCGLSKAGETLYPEAANNNHLPSGQRENNWWAFDTNAQATDCPMPGWVPGTSTWEGQPVTVSQARTWYDWYFNGLVAAHAWQLQVYRDAGWTGSVQFVTPGVGCLQLDHDARLNALLAPMAGDNYYVMNTGAVWWRFYNEMPDLEGCGLNASSIYDQSGDPRGNVTQPGDDLVNFDDPQMYSWSSARVLSSIARRHGLSPLMGENPGSTPPADAAKVFATAAGCGLDALLWAFDDQLNSGTPGIAQITDLTPLILLHAEE